jgi:hypothetical protein
MEILRSYLLFVIIIFSGLYFTSLAQLSSSELKILSEKADVILTGKVTQQASSWNENKTRIYTHATIQVEEYLKGNNNGSSISIVYPGGEVGEVGELYSHMPRFTKNEDVLLFLKKDLKTSDYKVLNGEDGKINLITDSKTGEMITTSKVKVSTLKAKIKSYTTN